MSKPIIIGLGYRARSGKDTVGDHLVKHHGFRRVAFADQLKNVVGLLAGEDAFDQAFKENVTIFGLTGGQLLQQVAMKLRELDPLFFVKASLLDYLSNVHDRIVVTDVRFKNEAAEIKRLGGVLWEIRRPGLANDLHQSETEGAQIQWDAVLHNDRDIAHVLIEAEIRAERLIRERQ